MIPEPALLAPLCISIMNGEKEKYTPFVNQANNIFLLFVYFFCLFDKRPLFSKTRDYLVWDLDLNQALHGLFDLEEVTNCASIS